MRLSWAKPNERIQNQSEPTNPNSLQEKVAYPRQTIRRDFEVTLFRRRTEIDAPAQWWSLC